MRLYPIPWLLLLTLAACKKDEVDALPKATQDGRGTMGCLVEGKAWTPYIAPQLGGGSPYVAYYRYRTSPGVALTMLFTRNARDKTPASSIYFFLPNTVGPGSVALDQPADPIRASFNPAYANYSDYKTGLQVDYLTGPTAPGTLTLTRFDTVARVASGTFSFTARALDGSTVQVTDGRFDVRLEKR
ncbi:hypothetical protein [Hymenobacter metallilatus]|uniref:DUF5025 domain-containing protein n=1 Tax=Hymenobacter metallilatus TaxID=2493666 RepID=A0A428JT14_9BACT|nr:hypothetical protein [Hymenobacter metallilatus]RSK37186.1 hypothetical protein EI290_00530 [Hymenobacter metallilatus]